MKNAASLQEVDYSDGDIKGEMKDGVNLTNQAVEAAYEDDILSDLGLLSGTVYD